MKKTLVAIGIAVVLLSAIMIWRALHPPLSDREQIAANLDGIAAAVGNRSAGGVAYYLAKDFDFDGTKKRDFQNQMVGGMLQFRVVELDMNGVEIEIDNDQKTAKCEGRYFLNTKREYNSAPESYSGNFELEWRKEDGEWKVTKAKGGLQIPN